MPRTISLDATARDLLARVWRDHGRPTLVLDRRAVAEIETGLRTKLRDDVLAILVAEGRLPGTIAELTEFVTAGFGGMFGPTWNRQLDFDHVIFTRLKTDDS